MPQPKKSGSPGRKPQARKPPAGQTGRKGAASGRSGGGKPRASQSAAPTPSADSSSTRVEARAAQRREDQLMAAIGGVRDLLQRGVVITGDRLQEVVDEAVKRGRMTREDAEELVQNVVQIGRRQAQDTLAELEGIVERSARQSGQVARSRVKNVGAAARRAPGGDRALRTVDRVRRAAKLGQSFPITGYDELTTAQIKERLADLSSAELRKVRDHERRNANRKSILAAIERKLG